MQIKEFNQDTKVILPITGGKYLFTVNEALAYIVYNDSIGLLDEMMFYNVSIRDAIRNNGIRAVADTLMELAPKSEKMKSKLDKYVSDDIHVADFDIQVLPATTKLTFYGIQTDIDQLWNCREITRRIGRWTSDRERKDNTLHVAELFEPYPCFDSYDYASETRDYDNFIIRDYTITEDYLMKLENANPGYNRCFTVDSTPSEFMPIVYHDGDSRFMYVATSKDNPQITPEELA